MQTIEPTGVVHPAGEPVERGSYPPGSWPVDTPGGRFYAEWDGDAPVTRDGQLMFFFQFLKAGGRWDELLRACPLRYVGNRGSGAANVLGTVFLSVLNGHWRYAHINAVRGDGVNPGLLGLERTVSEDAVRAAMARIPESEGMEWLGEQVLGCISPALGLPWILDIDVTVKPLYGRQEGAELGYNPKKPGRPSHVYHSYMVANLRLSLGVEVLPGNQHAGANGLPGLWRMLERLPRERWPNFARGDCGYGNETVMLECEQRGLPYLFKLRHTARVRELVSAMMVRGEGWLDCGDGWQAMEAELRLSGWSRERRVVLVREKPGRAPLGRAAEEPERSGRRKRRGKDRQGLLPPGWEGGAAPWCGKIAVLVSSLDVADHPTSSMPRHYRERADCENGFDELVNQWGWCGFTSRKLSACRMMANLVALIYNWWSLYLRFYDEGHHREAVRSRPMLMAGVARQVKSGGQRTVKVSIMHEKGEAIARAVTATSQELARIERIAERWSNSQRWSLILTRLMRRWLGGKWLPGLPPEASLFLSG